LDENSQLALSRVVFFERLQEGLSDVFADLCRPCPEMPHLNPTRQRPDYRAAFTDKTRAMFEEIYAKDIATWGYDFDTGLPRTDKASISSLSDLD
ncbi:MAG: hypothetical protein AAGO57_07530, partial [Pseudomonadota bacterium]